jgi:thioredoxin reductase (NADPH)
MFCTLLRAFSKVFVCSSMGNMIYTDICIIGAGPVGLFAVFEAGLLKMRCHVVDVLQQVGGQLAEVYPSKPIYDIPGYPEIQARQLIERLMEQIASFSPAFTLGERVESVERQPDGSLVIATNDGTQIACKVLVIAAGLGCFEPRKPNISDLSKYEGNGVSYMIKDHTLFLNKNVVIAGGGDAALDWALSYWLV